MLPHVFSAPRTRAILASAALIGALSACDSSSVKDTLGLTRKAPDEFRVVSRPPLSVPPEFNLRPPASADEASSINASASKEAEAMVFGSGSSGSSSSRLNAGSADTAVSPVTASDAASNADEQFLRNAGAQHASSDVRSVLRTEEAEQSAEEKSALEKLSLTNPNEPVVDADKEAARLKQNKAAGKAVTEGETPTKKPKDTGPLGRMLGY